MVAAPAVAAASAVAAERAAMAAAPAVAVALAVAAERAAMAAVRAAAAAAAAQRAACGTRSSGVHMSPRAPR